MITYITKSDNKLKRNPRYDSTLIILTRIDVVVAITLTTHRSHYKEPNHTNSIIIMSQAHQTKSSLHTTLKRLD